MRLIDADVLKQHIDKLPALPDGYFAGNHSALKALINMQPTIESSTNCSEIQNSSDCISRQAAIDALHMHLMYRMGTDSNKKRLDEWINNLPSAQPEQRWIPCSERLPEERGFYLTTTKDKAVYCDHWNEDNFDRTEMVIAWMPLPEAYQGGDE